jgi:two-component system LytT family response regulator
MSPTLNSYVYRIPVGDIRTAEDYGQLGNEQVKVLFEDICYLEAAGNYINFVIRDKSYLSRMTFSELEDLLPKKMFIRVHRSYIVGIKHIAKIKRHQLSISGIKIPIGESIFHASINGISE